MGVYLSTPSTDVEIQQGSSEDMNYVAGEMQGWRKNMEDDHIAQTDISIPGSSNTASVFAVFDGHGGKEVAVFCHYYFVEEMVKLESYRRGEFGAALKEAFLKLDSLLEDPRFEDELASYRKIPNPSDNCENFVKERYSQQPGSCTNTSEESGKINGESKDDCVTNTKKINVKEAVRLFAQLIAEEKSKKVHGGVTDGDRDVASIHAAAGMNSRRREDIQPFGEEGVIAVQANCEPASKISANGIQECNLAEHRVTAGCTAVVALRVGRTLYVANAGDSRGVLCRGGEAYPLSEDHKPQSEIEMKRITRVGGFVNQNGRINGNLNLSRSIGDLKYKQLVNVRPEDQMITADPDITTTVLDKDDEFMILACDGVWDILTSQAAVDFVRNGISQGLTDEEIVKNIFKECIAEDIKNSSGLGGDNMTCLLVRFHNLSSK